MFQQKIVLDFQIRKCRKMLELLNNLALVSEKDVAQIFGLMHQSMLHELAMFQVVWISDVAI